MPNNPKSDTRYYDPDTTAINEYPVYRECATCGIRLGAKWHTNSSGNKCDACKKPLSRAHQHQTGFTIPPFEITVFRQNAGRLGTSKTVEVIRAARVAYRTESLVDDRFLTLYIQELFGVVPLYCVTVTVPGEMLDAWAGHNPAKLAEWLTRATAGAQSETVAA